MITRRETLKTALCAAALPASAQQPSTGKVRHIDVIHHSHTDVGFTDIPSVCREHQVRFLDAALEACLRNRSFHWTAEATVTVDAWWRAASPQRRDGMVRMVRSGQMDIMALPFNQAPFMDARQWRQALDWLPADVRRELNPQAAMQNDVNGFPRAGALLLLDRNIHHLLMGINPDMGGPPFRRPAAFYWKMPDGRRLFVWLGEHYGSAYGWFEPKGWQHGQPKGATMTLRPPYAGDHLKTDEASLRAAQAQLQKKLAKLESDGYSFPRLILSYTNQWRYDNDPPFPPLAPFIDAWNKLGLQPPLRFTTATQAVRDMETAVSTAVPTHEGEFTDWWANGDASGPREVAASRVAKRFIAAAHSPVWGPPSPAVQQKTSEMLRDLCLFDEHTWGANISISQPYSLDTLAQYTEKSILAYKPMGHAEWLLGQRARLHFASKPAGTFVVNTAPAPFTGWISFPNIDRKPEWAHQLAPRSVTELRQPAAPSSSKPAIQTASGGWPLSARWPGMNRTLFTEGIGDLLSVSIAPPARRSSTMHPDRLARQAAAYGEVKLEETPHTLIYTQEVTHPSVERATRRLEIFRDQPRASLTVQFDRLPNRPPEVIYVLTPLPTGSTLPRFSNGGVPFTPFADQLPGSCRDYFAIDSWAHYKTEQGHWLWVTRDAPLVALGGPHTWQRIQQPPADPNRIWTMVFDNFWHTNFVADSHGTMEFQFELAWLDKLDDPAPLAETLLSQPLAVVNPANAPSPELLKSLFTP